MNNKYFNLYEQLSDPVVVTASHTALLDLAQITSGCSALLITLNPIFFTFSHTVSRLLCIISRCQVNLSTSGEGREKHRPLQAPLLICTIRNLCLQLI